MAWWDPFVDWISGAADTASNAVSNAASNVGQAVSGVFGDGSGGTVPVGVGDIAAPLSGISYGGGFPVNTTSLGSIDAASLGGLPANTTSLGGLDLASAGGTGSSYGGMLSGAGFGDSGLAESGGGGLMSQGLDWAKKNPELVRTGGKAIGTLMNKNTPAPAKQAAFDAAAAGNTAAASVGKSQINQAPFLADNAMAQAKLSGAGATNALQQKLQQQGYKPGDAMYDSAMQQQQLGNAQNEATAYAAGQGERAKQESSGAGLMQPRNLEAYGALGTDQNAQQTNENTKRADLAGLAGHAFDIWSQPDKQQPQQ